MNRYVDEFDWGGGDYDKITDTERDEITTMSRKQTTLVVFRFEEEEEEEEEEEKEEDVRQKIVQALYPPVSVKLWLLQVSPMLVEQVTQELNRPAEELLEEIEHMNLVLLLEVAGGSTRKIV
jgi:hypothetical protein